MSKNVQQPIPSKKHKRRYDHLERFSLAAVSNAARASEQLDHIRAMLDMIARDEQTAGDHRSLLQGLAELTHNYAAEARMDMEHLSIAQMRHTPRWKEFKKSAR
ncbi:hypothetical protein GCM10027093_01720 [Paraburkholderia jirisanensis]